jgi:hypothetical protein
MDAFAYGVRLPVLDRAGWNQWDPVIFFDDSREVFADECAALVMYSLHWSRI